MYRYMFWVGAGIPISDNYVFDTTLDLLAGFTGGFVGYYVAKQMQTL